MLPTYPHLRFFKLLSIDPGLHNTGITSWMLSAQTLEILSIDPQRLSSASLIDTTDYDTEDIEEGFRIRISQLNAYREILKRENPDMVVIESPFFNPKRPNSFKVLSEILIGLMDTTRQYDQAIRIFLIPPATAKKTIGVVGIKEKTAVRDALLKISIINQALTRPLVSLSDHEWDSILIGLTHLHQHYSLFEELRRD